MAINTHSLLRNVTVVLVCSVGWVTFTAAAPADDVNENKRSLDEQLLDDLDDDLFEGLDDIPNPLRDDSVPGDQPPRPSENLDRELLDDLEAGEDIGQGPEDPLVSIQRQMRGVERLIVKQNTSKATQAAQLKIITELQTLIEQQKKKCSGGDCDKPSDRPSGKPSGGKKAGAGENQGNSKPSPESADRVGTSTDEEAELDRMKRMLKEVWGHLPPKVRQQLQAGSVERFLPKYESLIEDYYKRLAEERID